MTKKKLSAIISLKYIGGVKYEKDYEMTALGLRLIGVSFINPVITEAGCQGYYADGKTGDIVPCK